MASAAGFIGGHVFDPKLELGAAYDKAMQKEIFDPLRMKSTTFDYKRALAGNHAAPHSFDIDGITRPAAMDLNYSIVPLRPAGGAWSSANDLTRYVQMELANGKLPDGKSFISEPALMRRRAPQVVVGDGVTYGMGLMVDKSNGIEIVDHGGDMIGFHSNMMWLPEAGVGAVILTNSDEGVYLRGPFLRRLLEVLFDGNPEAEVRFDTNIANYKEGFAVERKHLQLPADAAVAGKLAEHYQSVGLGEMTVHHKGKELILDFGEWSSQVATRQNDDGTVSLYTVEPGKEGFLFVVGEKDGKRTLTIRDGQHEYPFIEK